MGVHPNLNSSAALTCRAVDAFGATIDIYANTWVLSRCSKSLVEGVESAHHEQLMTEVWCRQAHTRIMENLNQLKDTEVLNEYKTMAKLSEAVCANNAPVQGNPLGF